MSLFPTKFVCDVGTLTVSASETLDATLTVGGTTILSERYTPANGQITVRGLRSVLEAAIYGDLNDVSNAHAAVAFTIGSTTESKTLYAARLKNPRDPNGNNTTLVAGDIVAVYDEANAEFPANIIYATTSGIVVHTGAADAVIDASANGGRGVRIWVDRTSCPDNIVAVRFLNRYDVPQTMMTTRPLEIKPAFQDQTALMYGQRVRYTVDAQDEYTLRSGRIHRMEEYYSWADLVTSRKAEVWYGGQWLPIIVTKSNFTAVQRSSHDLKPVEISFRMADPRQGL